MELNVQWRQHADRAIALGVLVGWMLACASGREPQRTGKLIDAGAYLACQKFAPLMRDVQAGVMTDPEVRAALKEMYRSASAWPNSDVARATAALLRTFTEGTGDIKAETAALVDACRDWQTRPTE